MNPYLFILGRDPLLSRTELQNFCDEILYDERESLLLAENLKFENPRDLPKTKEQIFLDRLGGTIRFAKVIGEFESEKEVFASILQNILDQKPDGKLHLGISSFGWRREPTKALLSKIKNTLREEYDRNCRVVNIDGRTLDSGKIFGDRLLQKGFEFVIWKKHAAGFESKAAQDSNPTFLLAQTVASQNLRNYTLRDRGKDFRDARMGMLPPKLAQILISLSNPDWDDVVIDPFCGSGTVNIEAAIMGYKTIGSDLDATRVRRAQENFEQMAEKFRYEKSHGDFFMIDAEKFPIQKTSGIIATEGFLGDVYEKHATREKIQSESQKILSLWQNLLKNLEDSSLHTLSFCLPAWNFQGKTISLSENLFAKLGQSSYIPSALFNGKRTFIYSRPGSFVGREICVLQKK